MKIIIKSVLFVFLPFIGLCQNVNIISCDNSQLSENSIHSIAIDSSGTKWIGTESSGLISLKEGKYYIYNDSTSRMKGKFISPVFVDKSNRIWVSVSKPNALYLIENGILTKISNKVLNANSSIIAIVEDEEGTLYFGGSNGVIKFESNNWTKIELPIKNPTVRALAINKNGDLAIGHNYGLLVRNNNEFEIIKESEKGLQLSVVRGLKYMNNNELIIGYGGGYGNGGFSILEDHNWTHFNRENCRIASHMVSDIEMDANGNYWMATNKGLTSFKDGEVDTIFFREGEWMNTIRDVALYHNEIWLATNFGIVRIEK